ncbi:general stress protein [Secundilactobacillus collinoides]|uniref:RNA-binding protein n=3 Tax=Secundilactobacillus collinoides TaxID=33960 RepID=A0A0R2B764_SECCO|nr:CvfD/Ygs/GSP13 family RNA-binding post-transcriptional regulator [Secundilactobacillus collinoides]KRM74693.1 RNA-binding protein [Secundilactobacillus collinoides DSM 20515 = JCM 1123]KZL36664.1 general stress protein [Secundilactobacillus collinoides]
MYHIGEQVTGTVTGIQPYGAFVDLGDNTQGLIHISECHYGFVKDIHQYLSVGQALTVVILDIDEFTGKISLSLRCLEEPKAVTIDQPENHHKHYWTSRNVHEGFTPIADRRHGWEQEALREFVRK